MKLSILPALGAVLVLAACGASEEAETPAVEAPADASTTQPPASVGSGEANPVVFDLSAVPISTATLGDFPYIAVPSGYEIHDERTLDLAAFPIWTGAAFQTIEGKVYMAQSKTPEGKSYSRLEFERGIENAVKMLGGVRVSRGEVPSEAFENLPSDVQQDASLGLGDKFGSPFTTFVVRRADRTLWIQVVAGQHRASWAVVDAPPATQ